MIGRVLIEFVGSGDAFGSGGRAQTCISLSAGAGTERVLVDCGATSVAAMKAQGLDPNQVHVVVVTHLHGDHFGGLPFLILDGQFSRRQAPLVVVGPPGTAARLAAAMEVLYPGSTSVKRRFDVDVREVTPDGTPVRAGEVLVRGWEVDHACGAPPLAVNVTMDGLTFGYSGDTAWTESLVSAAAEASVFAVEAYTFDKPVRYHLDYATFRRHANHFAAERIFLTHMSPAMLSRLPEADHPAAFDGMTLEL
jgi:ribonuclease BN (tRNA processing enzyme)